MTLFCMLSLLVLSLPAIAQAQNAADSLTELTVDIWPDYDRPSVLVLLTGRLPATVTLPARVTIPLPADATLNAVARLTPEGAMIDDIDFTEEDGTLTILVPEERFRVEYYAPYEIQDEQHSYLFEWFSDALSVDRVSVIVQQPAAADAMESTPAASETSVGPDGLTYLHLPQENVPAGDRYSVEFSYDATNGELTASSVEAQPAAQASLEPVVPAPASQNTGSLSASWPLLLAGAAGLLIVALVGWQALSRRQSGRRGKPARPRAAKTPSPRSATQPVQQVGGSNQGAGTVSYCHQCGNSVEAADRFCRNCGTKLKGR
jgi:hypothetical protein